MIFQSNNDLSSQNLETLTDSQRKAVFLKRLIKIIIGVHCFFGSLILIVFLFNPDRNIIGSILSLAINSGVYYLIYTVVKDKNSAFSYYFFCIYTNSLFLVLVLVNYDDSVNETLFSYMLGICIMFFVFFTDYKKSLISAFVNTAFILYIAYQPSLQWIAHTLPILSFFIIITAVAWIYQRTLDNSMISLQAARQQLMQDTLIRQELAIARNLQQELYPKPQHYSECLDIGASVQPALETSGDLYDLIRLNDDEIAIIVGDATGKSVAAAMVMAMTRSIIRSEARRSRNPGHVLRHVNAILHADDAVNQMMTVWYGVLNLRHHQLRFANAGHPFPLLRRNGVVQELEAFGTPLRSIRNFPYAEQTIQLQANDRLVV